jgi:hypothetical protein
MKLKTGMKDWWNDAGGGKRCYSEQTYPTSIYPITKLKWNGSVNNWHPCSEKPEANPRAMPQGWKTEIYLNCK